MEEKVVFRRDRSQPFGGLVKDVSVTGAFLVSSEQLTVHSGVVLLLPIRSGSKKKMISVPGRVVRIDGNRSTFLRGYGIQFETDFDEDTREELTRFIAGETVTDPHHHLSESHRLNRDFTHSPDVRPIEPVKFDQSVTNPGARLAHGKYRQTRKPSLIFWKLMVVALLALLIGVPILVWQVRSASMYSRFRAHVPMYQLTISDDVLRAHAPLDWIEKTPRREKEQALRNLAAELRQNSIHGAILKDSQNRTVAMIMRNISDPSRPGIRVMK